MSFTKLQTLVLGAMGAACIVLGADREGYLANIGQIYGAFILGALFVASKLEE